MFEGLRNALYLTCFISVLGGLFFFEASHHLPEDKKNVLMRGKLNEVVQDIVEDHASAAAAGEEVEEEEVRRRDEARYQSHLYRKKAEEAERKVNESAAKQAAATAAAAGATSRPNHHHNAVLLRYMRRSSNPEGHVNIGYVDDDEVTQGATMAKTAKRTRPVTDI